MRIHHLLVSLVFTAAACDQTTATHAIDHSMTDAIKPVRPLTKELSEPKAVELCGATAHVPTLTEAQTQLLEDCAPTADGFACVPRVEVSELEGTFWTATPCEHGFYVGNFDTGEVTCNGATSSAAQPLCIH